LFFQEQAEWSQFIQNFIHGPDADLDVRKHRLLLPRNLKGSSNKLAAPFVGAGVHNGLKAKIALRSYRMFFSEGSEDVFVRQAPTKRGLEQLNKAKKAKFEKWFNGLGFL
jgi:hypothetical protein